MIEISEITFLTLLFASITLSFTTLMSACAAIKFRRQASWYKNVADSKEAKIARLENTINEMSKKLGR